MCVFFNDTATTEIYTLSLHDALPIYDLEAMHVLFGPHRAALPDQWAVVPTRTPSYGPGLIVWADRVKPWQAAITRSEEHTSELQSRQYLVCRLLLEKKKSKRSQIPEH